MRKEAYEKRCKELEGTVRDLARQAKADSSFNRLQSLEPPLYCWARNGKADYYYVSAKGGKQVRRKVGISIHSKRWGGLTVEQAIQGAGQLEVKVVIEGAAPPSEREQRARAKADTAAEKHKPIDWREMTVEQAIDVYLLETAHRHLGKKLPGRRWQRSPVEKLYPLLLTDLQRHHITGLRDEMKAHPAKANRTIGTLIAAVRHVGFDRLLMKKGDKLREVRRVSGGAVVGKRRSFSEAEMVAFGTALAHLRQFPVVLPHQMPVFSRV